MRGAPQAVRYGGRFPGIIPACAGSTFHPLAPCHIPRDHPRMCGEHVNINGKMAAYTGSSPHVRGALHLSVLRVWRHGIIPACAGSTHLLQHGQTRHGDHPRMCGEHSVEQCQAGAHEGSSPHVRGARHPRRRRGRRQGIIPACAGSTTSRATCRRSARDHPRMCGEHPFSTLAGTGSPGSSPHVRGAPNQSDCLNSLPGIIPACAGSTVVEPVSR